MTERRACPVCGALLLAGSLREHIRHAHGVAMPACRKRWPDLWTWINETRRANRWKERHALEDAIECRICGDRLHQLGNHLRKVHGIDSNEYRRRYPGAALSSPHTRAVQSDLFADRFGGPYWTRERVIAAIKRWEQRTGEPPRFQEWRSAARRPSDASPLDKAADPSRSRPTAQCVKQVFGTWGAAIRAAGFTPGVRRQQKRCHRGHPLTPDNLYVSNGQRWCRTCKLRAQAARYARNREARAA